MTLFMSWISSLSFWQVFLVAFAIAIFHDLVCGFLNFVYHVLELCSKHLKR